MPEHGEPRSLLLSSASMRAQTSFNLHPYSFIRTFVRDMLWIRAETELRPQRACETRGIFIAYTIISYKMHVLVLFTHLLGLHVIERLLRSFRDRIRHFFNTFVHDLYEYKLKLLYSIECDQ